MLCQEAIIPLTLVTCKPIGVLEMTDGVSFDEKIIAVPVRDPSYNSYASIKDIPVHIFDEISNFFEVYKTLEGVQTEIKGVNDVDVAVEVIKKAMDGYKEEFLNK